MSAEAVVKNTSYCLFHTPSLVQYGSKPSREIRKDKNIFDDIAKNLRNYEKAKSYPPHQVYIGNLSPDQLNDVQKPWFEHLYSDAGRFGPFGEIMPEDEFLGLLKIVDNFGLVWLTDECASQVKEKIAQHRLITPSEIARLDKDVMPLTKIKEKIGEGKAIPLYRDITGLAGCVLDGHDEDDTLKANIILENLACKASGYWVIKHLLNSSSVPAGEVEYVINCGEEASGDRYQRGGGNLAKAMAEHAGIKNATGSDLKAYCCAPIHAAIVAASLVRSGIMENVIVVGGGSLPKLGMKYKGHLSKSIPILEDVLASVAFMIGKDDGVSPRIRFDVVGRHTIETSDAPPLMMQKLIVSPLQKSGFMITDIDKYALELHNHEITEPAGSGDPALNNYKTIASIAALRGEIDRQDINSFILKHGMPGFSPTQGHIAAGVPFLGHATKMLLSGELRQVMFVAKGSLFLGKMTNLSDGMSFLLEARNSTDGICD